MKRKIREIEFSLIKILYLTTRRFGLFYVFFLSPKKSIKNPIACDFLNFLTLILVPECKGLGFNGFCGHLVDS